MPRRPRSSPAPQIRRGDRSPEELLQSNLFIEDLIRRGILRREQQQARERAETARRAVDGANNPTRGRSRQEAARLHEQQQNRHQLQYQARHRAAAAASRRRIEAAGIARRARRARESRTRAQQDHETRAWIGRQTFLRGNSGQGRYFPRASGVSESVEPPIAFPVGVPTPSSPPPLTTPYSECLSTTPVLRATVYSCTPEQYLIVVHAQSGVHIRYLPRGEFASHFGLPPHSSSSL